MGLPAIRARYSFMNNAARLLGNTTTMRDISVPHLSNISSATYSKKVLVVFMIFILSLLQCY